MHTSRTMQKHVTHCPHTNRLLNSGTIGELQTVEYLYTHLKTAQAGNYHVLVNYHLPLNGANTFEIDLLAITTFGIFVIEVKNWKGSIEAYDSYWFAGGWQHPNVLNSLSMKAKLLHSHISKTVHNLSVNASQVNISPLIVLVRGLQSFKNHSSADSQAIVSLDPSLLHALSSSALLRHQQCPRLTDTDIAKLRDSLFRQHQSEKDEIVGHYRLLKKTRDADLFEEFEAQHTHVSAQRVRLKCYHLHTLYEEQRVSEKMIEQFKRNIEVVSSIGYHPNIVQTQDFFPDAKYYDYFYEVTEPVDGQRFDEVLTKRHRAKQGYALKEQIPILQTLCDALQHAHHHCDADGHPNPVYHRNVSLETVFLTHHPRTRLPVIKLADFDFAKFGPHTLNPIYWNNHASRRKKLIQKVFTAPEVLADASDASVQSDIYALGIFWYFLASLPNFNASLQFNPQTDMARLNRLRLPASARDLLASMLAYNPGSRPSSMQEISSQLQY